MPQTTLPPTKRKRRTLAEPYRSYSFHLPEHFMEEEFRPVATLLSNESEAMEEAARLWMESKQHILDVVKRANGQEG